MTSLPGLIPDSHSRGQPSPHRIDNADFQLCPTSRVEDETNEQLPVLPCFFGGATEERFLCHCPNVLDCGISMHFSC